jgi:hypothetical protein
VDVNLLSRVPTRNGRSVRHGKPRYSAKSAEDARAAEISRRVKEVISAGPPGGRGSPLDRHLAWPSLARRREVGAAAREAEATGARQRREALLASAEAIKSAVRAAAAQWASYATSTDDDAYDMRPMPSTGRGEIEALESEAALLEPVSCIAPVAQFEAEVARGVVAGLELLLEQRQAEAEREAEGRRLIEQAHNLAADLGVVYCQMRALDLAIELDFDTIQQLRALGVAPLTRLVPVTANRVELPAVNGSLMGFEIRPDPDALGRFRALQTTPRQPAGGAPAVYGDPRQTSQGSAVPERKPRWRLAQGY